MRARPRRKLLLVVSIGTAVAAAVRVLRGGPAPAFVGPAPDVPRLVPDPPAPTPSDPAAAPEPAPERAWPAADPVADAEAALEPPATGMTGAAGTAEQGERGVRWVHPVEGRCPPGHPIKVKLRSGIFHAPGMLAYERTAPDRCYATADDALADGFRAAKR